MADSVWERLAANVKTAVLAALGDQTFTKVWEYTVTGFDEGAQTADASPVNNQDLPPVAGVPIRLPGMKVVLTPGMSVVIGFIGANPSKPYVAQLDNAAAYSTALATARQGDTTMTSLMLVPAIGPAGPIPNVYSITIPPPGPPPPFVPNVGGPATFVGIVATGSIFTKTK